jgi:hypothetical protein
MTRHAGRHIVGGIRMSVVRVSFDFLGWIRTSPIRASGSYLECLTAKRWSGQGMKDARRGEPAGDQLRHPVPREAVFLAAPPKRATPEVG